MSNINRNSTNNDLRLELQDLFGQLKDGKIEPALVKELNNTAGKIMSSVKIQLQYAELRKETPDIDFLK